MEKESFKKDIFGNLCRSTDILAYNEIKALIEKLEK